MMFDEMSSRPVLQPSFTRHFLLQRKTKKVYSFEIQIEKCPKTTLRVSV